MKNTIKMIGIITMVAVIGFSMVACGGDDSGDPNPNPDNGGGTKKWTEATYIATSMTYYAISQIIFANGKFIAVGDAGVATSTDGVTWAKLSDRDFSAIAYGDNKFYAVSSNGKISTSSDGTTWTDETSGVSATFGNYCTFKSIVYANNKWVAVGDDRIGENTSGTWVAATKGTGDDEPDFSSIYFPAKVIWGNNRFIAVGRGARVAATDSTGKWIKITSNYFDVTNNNLNSVVWGKDKFVVGGGILLAYSATGDSGTQISTSPGWDNISATHVTDIFGANGVYSLAYENGKWMGGGLGCVATSTDGKVWATDDKASFGTTTTDMQVIQGLVYGAGKWVAYSMEKVYYKAEAAAE
ncbi:MAG: hypothetical protein LBG95_06100 [Treponema sp.]|jgi:hypothetical protein|nr:hypothetical protein [Treponema sp.]